ncbi:Protein CBG12762 [Caenorhabditis briggsae]|uniref:Protein CBG12762 n=1 Tax=Caenorhabditis briggsae TaxID=6238 RepID=A8XGI5_CAEBR|nr:Protein CBG12762 [Caenorhabditis briggsae]CAP31691.1 Protein CBG12762 [Caenorhabditis briggsae]
MSASNSNGIAKSSKAKTTNAGSSGTPTQEAPTDTVMEDLSSGPLLLLPKACYSLRRLCSSLLSIRYGNVEKLFFSIS